jgi:hypothetical protein
MQRPEEAVLLVGCGPGQARRGNAPVRCGVGRHGQAAEKHTAQEATGAIGEEAYAAKARHHGADRRLLYVAFERLDADPELLVIVGSWRDTLGDFEVLTMLRDYEAGRPTLHRPQ